MVITTSISRQDWELAKKHGFKWCNLIQYALRELTNPNKSQQIRDLEEANDKLREKVVQLAGRVNQLETK